MNPEWGWPGTVFDMVLAFLMYTVGVFSVVIFSWAAIAGYLNGRKFREKK